MTKQDTKFTESYMQVMSVFSKKTLTKSKQFILRISKINSLTLLINNFNML